MALAVNLREAGLTSLALAKIGNPLKGEPLLTSKELCKFDEEESDLLTSCFLNPFRSLDPHQLQRTKTEEGNPLFEYYAAISRKDHDGFPEKGWESQECISRMDALKMFTTWAAYGEFAEHRRGKIRPGFDADLTILSQNITKCTPNEILKTEILGTMVAGKMIYNKL